jgi:hypothetical protein
MTRDSAVREAARIRASDRGRGDVQRGRQTACDIAA